MHTTTYAGEVKRSKARSSRSTVILFDLRDPEAAWLGTEEVEGVRWETLCDDHSTTCLHATRATAMSFLAAPEEWCEMCREAIEVEEVAK